MKWIGQSIWDQIARFRNDVYLESISTGTIASGAHLGLDSNNKIVKAVDGGGDLTSIVAGTGLSGTSLTGPIPTINIDAAQPTVTSLGTLTGVKVQNNGAFMSENVAGGTRSLIALGNDNILRIKGNDSEGSSNVISMIAGGNVGIGTTSPGEKLEVSGKAIIRKSGSATAHGDTDLLVTDATAASSTAAIQILGGNAGFSNLQFSDTDSYSQGAIMYGHTDNYMAFKANAAEKMRITSAGKVGIGTASPSQGLHVVDGGILVSQFESSDNTQSQIQVTNSSGTDAYFGISGSRLVLSNNDYSADHFSMDSSGNIGVGVTAPASKLHVAGTVQVGVDDTGHDVTFYGDASGEYMQWDTSEAKLKIIHTDEAVGLEVYTNASAQTTQPQLKVGRAATEYWGAYCADRTAHLVHRQDETSGSPNTSFEIWDSNTTDSAAYWVWRHANGSGGSLTEKMRLTKAGILSVAELDVSGNIDIDGITNLDVVDIDGAVQIDSTLTVGVDDTGHDVRFYGATSGRYLLWDESADALKFTDSAQLILGTGNDLIIQHASNNSYINNFVGDFYIKQQADDKDIIFQSDDGSGGVETYFFLDGSRGGANPATMFPDNSRLFFGNGEDLVLYHDGSNNFIQNQVGDLTIKNLADDKDIIFQSDDGSGGVETYFFLDGSQKFIIVKDSIQFCLGTSQDIRLYHDGSNASFKNYTGNFNISAHTSSGDMVFTQYGDDRDIIFQSDDGAGGVATYFKLDGSLATHDGSSTTTMYTKWEDNSIISLGTSNDIRLYHNGTNSYLDNLSGDYYIRQKANDKDLILECDDGSGGNTAYLTLDGSAGHIVANKEIQFLDNIVARFGTGNDLSIYHTGTATLFDNNVGNMSFRQYADNGDISFQSDNGSGGLTEYFRLDGGDADGTFTYTKWADNSIVALGAGKDLRMYHNGTNSIIQNYTGNLSIRNGADDGDIIFDCDDGSGGLAEYFRLDGGAAIMVVSKEMRFADNVKLKLGNGPDSEFYHDGSNTYITNATGNLYIDNGANDADIIFKGTDATADITALTLDMSAAGKAVFNSSISIPDAGLALFGTGNDLQINHDGSNSYINHVGTGHMYIQNTTDDKDIILRSDDGSGSVTPYLTLDGGDGHTIANKEIQFVDGVPARFGSGNDMAIRHTGSHSFVSHDGTGNLYIDNTADDTDTIFRCDDGSGGTTAYLTLDGGDVKTYVHKDMKFNDSVAASFGNNDFQILHDGTNTRLYNYTGNMQFINYADDADIIFQCDDGSGGVETYFFLDGSVNSGSNAYTVFPDTSVLAIGSGRDLRLSHNGTDSYVQNLTGDLILQNQADDKDIILKSDDGSGGVTAYLTLDGSAGTVEVAKEMNLAVPLATDQQKHVMHYDFQGYASGDGTNYEMANNLSDTNAPFEHNISIGADGTTATTVQNIIRSGGKVMPRACTLTRWTGWAAAAGSATAYVALFKVTPTRNSNTDLSAVLLDEFSYTALGNAKMEDFDETSFTATAIAAGDILITAMKSQSGAVHYFTSTVEVEF